MTPALLILWGATVILQADLLPDEEFLLLPPVNFTIKVTGLAQVLLRWEPNPDQESSNVELGYHVRINAPQEDEYETRSTESTRVTILHEGFSASVQTIPWDGHAPLASRWVSAELGAPPGSPGTSVVNLTCITNTVAYNHTHLRPYRVSLNCSWLVGKDAPEDTQYSLYYRYGSRTEECQEYSQDTLKRNSACWFPEAFITGKGRDWLAVQVNGSSKHAAIRPFDQLFALHAIDQVNPPVNVTAGIEGTRLSIQWEKPVSAFPTHCFDYEVKIYNTRKGYFQIGANKVKDTYIYPDLMKINQSSLTEKMTTSNFTSTISDISQYSIQVRAAVSHLCRAMGLWSEWSRPVYVGPRLDLLNLTVNRVTFAADIPLAEYLFPTGNDERKPWTEQFLAVLTAALCFLFISLTCRTCHLWTKLFPPVPAPKSTIKDFIAAVHYEGHVKTEGAERGQEQKSGSGETEIEVLSYVEELGPEVLEDFVF